MSDYEPNNGEDLESYLSSRPEADAQGYLNGDGDDASIIDHEALTVGAPPSDQGFAVPPGVVSQPRVASPPPAPAQPSVSQEEYEAALQAAEYQAQVNMALVRQQIEAEEARFESSIAHLDQYSQNYYRNQRYLQQYAEANEGQQQRIRQLEYEKEYREQSEAKQQVALIRMLQRGENLGDKEARADILSAETSEQMDARVALWARVHGLTQQQRAAQVTRAQTAAGAYAAAPQRGSARTAPRSRSLEEYVSSRAWVASDY